MRAPGNQSTVKCCAWTYSLPGPSELTGSYGGPNELRRLTQLTVDPGAKWKAGPRFARSFSTVVGAPRIGINVCRTCISQDVTAGPQGARKLCNDLMDAARSERKKANISAARAALLEDVATAPAKTVLIAQSAGRTPRMRTPG